MKVKGTIIEHVWKLGWIAVCQGDYVTSLDRNIYIFQKWKAFSERYRLCLEKEWIMSCVHTPLF